VAGGPREEDDHATPQRELRFLQQDECVTFPSGEILPDRRDYHVNFDGLCNQAAACGGWIGTASAVGMWGNALKISGLPNRANASSITATDQQRRP
jgi:hypothetical protein